MGEDWVDVYEQCWAARADVFDRLLVDECSLSRVLALFRDFEDRHDLMSDGQTYLYCPTGHADDPQARLEAAVPQVLQGRPVAGAAYMDLRLDRFLAQMSRGKDCVLELGGGYGRVLMSLWLAGGERGARYICAEPSPSGRRMAERLAALEPDLRLETVPFDFREPALPDVSECADILIVTHWSLMYAQPFDTRLFQAIQAIPGKITCVFVEPFGFQLMPDGPNAAAQVQQMRVRGYNMDFYGKLCSAGAEAGLDVTAVKVDAFGDSDDPLQLATIIVACR